MFKKKLTEETPIQESPKAIVDNSHSLQQPYFRIPDIILKKRNGHELTKDEINFFINAICELNNNQSLIQESQIGLNSFFSTNFII
jgi:hypothetical protein